MNRCEVVGVRNLADEAGRSVHTGCDQAVLRLRNWGVRVSRRNLRYVPGCVLFVVPVILWARLLLLQSNDPSDRFSCSLDRDFVRRCATKARASPTSVVKQFAAFC
jgi:hypothetical protein